MNNPLAEISDLLKKVNTDYNSIGEAQTSIKAFQTLLNKYLIDRLSSGNFPKELTSKMEKILEHYNFFFEVVIKAKIGSLEVIKDINGIRISNPEIKYSVEIVKSPEQVLIELDDAFESIIQGVVPTYLKRERSMMQLLKSFQDRIVYSEGDSQIPETNDCNDMLELIIKRNFDVTLIKNAKYGDEYGNNDYFEISPMKNIHHEIITSPAIIRNVNGTNEVVWKGTMLIPDIKCI
jgi:hypothetical protein